MKLSPLILPIFLSAFALLGSGCVMQAYDEPPARSRSATLLTLVDESGQLTPEQLAERRRNIISYLVAEGYIYSGEDLVQSQENADQIIRARLALDGSFELTIYKPERISYRPILFDPEGEPAYAYNPGDIGYAGDGYEPYYVPLLPIPDRRGHEHHREEPHDRDRDRWQNGYRPDRNRDHQAPRPGEPDRDHDHRPAGDRPKPDAPDPRHDRDQRPGDKHQPAPGGPVAPGQNQTQPTHPKAPDRHQPSEPSRPQSPGLPPGQGTPPHQGDPNNRQNLPDRQPRANPPGTPTTRQPSSAPTQPDQPRSRPKLPPLPSPSTPAARPDSPPAQAPAQGRFHPEGPSTSTPPARPAISPKPAPDPARGNSNKYNPPPAPPAKADSQNKSDPPAIDRRHPDADTR